MDAADDPGDAQLCWPRSSGVPPWSGKHRSLKLSGTFDLFEDIPVGVKELGDSLPPSVQVHDIAADDDIPAAAPHIAALVMTDDSGKKMQDDVTTPGQHATVHQRAPWADVALDDTDFAFHDAIAELANLNGQEFCDSHELRTQSGPSATTSQHQAQCGPLGLDNEQHEPCAPGDADTMGYDYSSDPQSDISVPGDSTAVQRDSPQTLRTQYGLLPSDGFLDHARRVLPDVYQDSDPSEAFSDVAALSEEEGDEDPKVEATTSASRTATPLPLRGSGSPGTSPGGGMEESCSTEDRLGTSSLGGRLMVSTPLGGPTSCPPHRQPAPVAPCFGAVSTCLAPAVAAFEGDAALAASHDAALAALKDYNSLISQSWSPIGGTQCGPLPLDEDFDFFPDGGSIFDSDRLDSGSHDHGIGTQCGPLPQHDLGRPQAFQEQKLVVSSLGTQCGHLPQQQLSHTIGDTFDDALASMQSTLAQLVAASVGTSTIADRFALLEQYGAATRQFERFEQAQYAPPETSWTDVQTKETQCGPLPRPGSSFSAISDIFPAQYTPQEPGTSQCGPLPQFGPSHIQTITDNFSAQYAPQMLEATRILPTTRTQCGPLPQPGSSSSQASSDTSSAQQALQGVKTSKRKGKRRGKGKN